MMIYDMMIHDLLKAALVNVGVVVLCMSVFSSPIIYHVVCLQGYDSPTALLLPGHFRLDTV